MFDIISGCFPYFSWFNTTIGRYWKHLSSFFRIYCSFFYLVARIYIWSFTIQVYFMSFIIQQISPIGDKITKFRWCFYPNLISLKKCFQNVFDKFDVLSQILICMLSLLECITRSSLSLEEIKLIDTVSWIFHISDFFEIISDVF